MIRLSSTLRILLSILLLTACVPIQPITPNRAATSPPQAPTTANNSAPISPPAEMTPEEIYAEAVLRLDRFLALVGELRAAIDRTQFDLTELGFALGFDAEPLVAFVRDEIAFEQYPGLLRGAQGTLLGRAGNALDQAVLLTSLLSDAGYETRIAQGTLTAADAELLIQQMATPRAAPLPPGDPESMQAVLTEMGSLSFEPPEEIQAIIDASFAPPAITAVPLYETVQANTHALIQALTDADIPFANGSQDDTAPTTFIREAQSYHWVEYRLGPGDEWQSAHPAFGNVTPDFNTLTAEEWFTDGVPAALHHRLRFQALIARTNGKTAATTPLFAPWETTVAAVVGQPLTYHNHPDGVTDLNQLADLTTVLAESSLFLPIFNQEIMPDANAFDITGTLFDGTMDADNNFALEPLGQALGNALDILGSLGGTSNDEEDAAAGQLTAYQLAYTLIAPDGSTEEFTRTIWSADHAKDSVDAQQGLRAALATQHTFMVAPGTLNTAFILDQTLARVERYGPLLHHMLRQNVFPEEPQEMPQRVLQTLETAWLGHLSLYKAFDAIGQSVPDQRLYRAEPTLVRYSQQLVDNRVAHALDILNNTQRAFGVVDGNLTAMPATVLRAGVWETFVETELLSAPDMAITASAAAQLNTVNVDAPAFQVFTAENHPKLQSESLSTAARAWIAQDLADGFVVVIPTASLTNGDEDFAWWRVHPETGETLGRLANGFGGVMAQSTVEYVIKIGAHVILFTIAFAHCIGIVATTVGKVGGGQIIGCIGLSLAFAFARFPTDLVDGVLLLLSISGLFVC